jgi:hypothetical protein
MAQKPWPAQMGAMALLPEQMCSLQASLGYHGPLGHAGPYYTYPTGFYTRVVGAHPHEGWRGAHHLMRRASQLPQPHVGPGGPHALLNEISGQALHRYRACHSRTDAVDSGEIDARCAATLASAQRLTAALLAICAEPGSNASFVAGIAETLAQLQQLLPGESTESDSRVGAIEQLRAQLDSFHAQMAERQAKSTEGNGWPEQLRN